MLEQVRNDARLEWETAKAELEAEYERIQGELEKDLEAQWAERETQILSKLERAQQAYTQMQNSALSAEA